MRIRSDGEQTRRRILEAACAVFAEKGFRTATTAEICRRAKANSASINYHFRDKESLYVAVWKFAAARALELYPFDGGVAADAPAADRLRGHIQALLRRMTDSGRLGHFHRLHMLEMANPTGLIDDVIREIRQPHREQMMCVLGELLGPEADAASIQRCLTSVIGQCQGVRLSLRWRRDANAPPLTDEELTAYADHIAQFSLGGIQSIRRHLGGNGQ